MEWNEARQSLTIGKRSGQFPGMLKERTFNVVFISENHGVGGSQVETPDAVVQYHGSAVTVTCKK